MGKGGERGKLGNSALVVGGLDAPDCLCSSLYACRYLCVCRSYSRFPLVLFVSFVPDI